MSFEFRCPVFNFTGTLSASCTAIDTTLSSQAFSTLPVISGTASYIPLVIANDAVGKEEIVWITGHTTASNSVTVVRAREGTTANTFTAGDVVRCTPTLRDVLGYAPSSSLPTSPHYGMRVAETDANVIVEYGPSGWAQASPFQAISGRRHHWQQLNSSLASGATLVTVSGMVAAANHTGNIATYSAGNITLNKAGVWTLKFVGYSTNTVNGAFGVSITWANGAFLTQPWQYVSRVGATGVMGNELVECNWTGYVTSAQAAVAMQPGVQQANTNSGTLNGCNFDFTAEYLGGS